VPQPLAATGFNLHLTLLYDEGRVAEEAIPPVGWRVGEFVLVHSRIGRNLPYALLGRWPLHN
jgi:2'-5' RNA ligase